MNKHWNQWWIAVFVCIVPMSSIAPASDSRPNIIVIMADDMGWSDLGCYGGEIKTPHIDSLAKQGLRFRQFYNNSVCGPTRASLLTGLYCQQVGHSGRRWNEPKDFSKCLTIAELLRSAGYHTLMVGKWQGRDLAVKRGFDRFFGPMCQGKISFFQEVKLNPFYLDDKRWQFPKEGFYMPDAFTDHAVQFVEEAARKDQPFFLYAAYIVPHWPLHAPEADIKQYRKLYRQQGWDVLRAKRFQSQRKMRLIPDTWKLSPRPKGVPAWKDVTNKDWQAERMAVYAAQISAMDRGVGRILQAVKTAGKEDNTLIMFLSDNGAAVDGGVQPTNSGFGFAPNRPNNNWRIDGVAIRPGSGPKIMPGPADTFAGYGPAWCNLSNTPLFGTKSTAYEGGVRTPLIVRWPTVIKKHGQFTGQVGHVMDIMATCADVSGGTYPKELSGRKPIPPEGKSLLPIFKGKQRDGHKELCWDAPRNQAILMGPWKLVNAGHNRPWELYNLSNDTTESNNLAKAHPQRVADMSQRYELWKKRVGVK